MDTLRLDLALLLPDVPDARDACVSRLTDRLLAEEGVERAHLVERERDEPRAGEARTDSPATQLCIHYDPVALPLPRIRQLAEQAGTHLTDRYGHVLWPVEGLWHQRRARTVAERLRQHEGVLEAEANAGGPLRVEFDRTATTEAALLEALRAMGARATLAGSAPPPVEPHGHEHRRDGGHRHEEGPAPSPSPPQDDHTRPAHSGHTHSGHTHSGHTHSGHTHSGHTHSGHTHDGVFGERTELIFALLSGVFLAAGWLLDAFADAPTWLPLAGYVAAYACGGAYTLREAVDSMRARHFEIDFLMLVAAAGAAALGAWAEGALLLFLFSLGHALEHYAMSRARRAIEALAELVPPFARVRRDGREREVPVQDLRVGDVVLVRTHERLPADGFVLEGESAVNQAPVTGESLPVDKKPVKDPEAARRRPDLLGPDHRVFAGTINGSGALEVGVTRPASETTLARVVAMINEAQTEQSPTQRFTDRFERYFVPAVLGLVGLLLFAWVVVDEPFSASFYRAMAVLVAASPCALAIATPSAVLSGVARAGRGGVLVKGGGPLEHLGTLRAIAFDKTGTLTEGEPQVTDVVPVNGHSEDELLRAAVAIEKLSDHPLAEAVVRYGAAHLDGTAIEEARDLASITGRGVRAVLGGDTVHIGKDDLFAEVDGPALPEAAGRAVERLEREGRTTMIVRRGDAYLGVIGLMDTPREAAASVIEQLRALGIERLVMISGDNQRVVESVGRTLGLDEARGDLLPGDKVETIKRLRAEAQVAMVGDGVNDAPAMANATVGIAMGAAGSDVALETADVALMADDLTHLPFAVGLSRQTSRIIKQNLWMSLGMVALLVPATVFGLGIGPAVALHEGSTLVVVFNALRLMAYRA